MSYTIDRAAIDAFCNSRSGPIYRIIADQGARVTSECRSQASGRKVKVRTGRFVASWNMTLDVDSKGPIARIFNTAPYAAILEYGSRPHPIDIKYKKILFNHETGIFYGTHVNHPGTKAYNILRDALAIVTF